MQPPSSEPVRPSLFPARFFGLAAACLTIASVWLALRPEMFLARSPDAAALGWAYLIVVGTGLSAAFGACYALAPNIFRTVANHPAVAGAHFWVHLASILLVIPLFLQGGAGAVSHYWLVLYAVPLAFVVRIVFVLHNDPAPGPAPAFFRASALWLMASLLAALTITANAHWHFLRDGHWIAAVVPMVLVGVFANTILGAALAAAQPPGNPLAPRRNAWLAFVLTNFGLVFLCNAIALGPDPLAFLCAAVLLGGVSVFGTDIYRSVRGARVDVGSQMILMAAAIVVPAAVIGLLALRDEQVLSENAPLLGNAFAAAAILGVIALGAIGALSVTVPALLAAIGKFRSEAQETPSIAREIQIAGYINYVVGISVLVPGIGIHSEKAVSLGAFFLLMGVIAFLIHLLTIIRNTKPAASEPAGTALPSA